MKAMFLLSFALMTGGVAYEAWHLWRLTPMGWPLKLTVTGLFLLWLGLMLAAFFFTEKCSVKVATFLYEAGHPWIVAFVYLLIVFLLADLATACHVLPRSLLHDNAWGLLAVIALIAVLMAGGSLHYHHKYREELTLRTEKPLDKPLTVVLASDLHLGYHNRRQELSRWVDLINAEHPDLVLFGGDIVDRSVRTVLEGGFAEEFKRLEAPVWTILGNHEYYSDVAGSRRFLEAAGITLLRDSVRLFAGIRVVGRDDRTNPGRRPLTALVPDTAAFTILLDHQPFRLEEAEQAGVDFQFSGHTHRGQFWPVSWITDAMFEKSWGHHTRGDTRYYISSGLGIWGPKIRIGTRSEYLVLRVDRKH